TEPVHQAPSGEWIITNYEDARAILKDDRFKVGNRAEWLNKVSAKYLDKWQKYSAIIEALQSFLVFKNPPDHTALRKLVMQAWNNREVDDIIKSNIQYLLDKANSDQIDIASDLATPLPTLTMTKILGLPEEDHDHLARLSHQMMKSLDFYLTFRELGKMTEATRLFTDYFERLTEQKLAKPDDKLLSRLILLNEEKNIPHHELIANCYFLFIAGGETTAGLIGPGLFHLVSQNKFTRDNLVADSVGKVVDELLRFDSPTQLVGRIASTQIKVADHEFAEGDLITVCLGAANRDPKKFKTPDELALDRNPNHHLAFSTGIHRCLGDWLAKRELELLLIELSSRHSSISIVEPPVWKENFNFRCLQSFLVSCN
ncbi:MAG: cytochrome P450, partial [Cyclobacteriaceae bacterium]